MSEPTSTEPAESREPAPNTDADGWTVLPGCESPVERLEMRDLDLVAEITHPIRGQIVRHLRKPRTVAELAEYLDAPITRLYHHVHRLTDLGLIRVVAERRVAAVTERRYQVVAKSLAIDEDLLTSTDVREVSVALSSVFDMAKFGFQRMVEAGGLTKVDDERDERSTLSLGSARLSDERRGDLMVAIQELVESFTSDVEDDDESGTRIALFIAAYEDPT
jgi:DNA-binding transcriptional ArsR family regulator